jgi:hypothetical protein
MEVPVIVDGRNLLDPEIVRAGGFEYLGMGRNPLEPEVAPLNGHKHSDVDRHDRAE